MLTLARQRGNTRLTVYSPYGVIGLSPNHQTSWLEQHLARGENEDLLAALVQLVRTVSEIHVQNQAGLSQQQQETICNDSKKV